MQFSPRPPHRRSDRSLAIAARPWTCYTALHSCHRILHCLSRDGSVSIATGYGPDGTGSIPGKCFIILRSNLIYCMYIYNFSYSKFNIRYLYLYLFLSYLWFYSSIDLPYHWFHNNFLSLKFCLFSIDFCFDNDLILWTLAVKWCMAIGARPHVCGVF
jgi:hypothetical protein